MPRKKNPDLMPVDKVETVAEALVLARKKKKWSQEDLEEHSGVSRSEISRIEGGKINPGFEIIEMLEEALEADLFDLFMKHRKETGAYIRRKKKKQMEEPAKSADEKK